MPIVVFLRPLGLRLKDIDHSSDITPIRKQIANSMTRAHVNIANTMLVFEVDVTELISKYANPTSTIGDTYSTPL